MSGTGAPPVLWTSTFTSGTLAHQVACVSGVPFEARFISLRAGDHRKPAFVAINPKGQVPVLELADGVAITEVPAILQWFAEAAPDSGLLPREPARRMQGIGWIAWCHWTFGRDFAAAFNPRYFGGEDAASSIRAAAIIRVRAALDLAEAALAKGDGTLLRTPQPSAPDIYLATLGGFAGALELDLGGHAALTALLPRVAALPGVAAATAKEKAHG